MKLRDMETPSVLGYDLNRETLTPTRKHVDTTNDGDYGSDPLGDGLFKMIPTGDIVDTDERNSRLAKG